MISSIGRTCATISGTCVTRRIRAANRASHADQPRESSLRRCVQRPGLDSKCFPKTSQFDFLPATERSSIPILRYISVTYMARPERFELPTPWFVARRSAEHLPPFKQLEAIVREACLSRVRDCEARLQALEGSRDRQRELTPEQRDAYLALGEDLQRVWSHESTPAATAQASPSGSAGGDHRDDQGPRDSPAVALEGRRPLASGGAPQPHRRAPVDHRCSDGSADPRPGPHAARRVDCRSAQPLGQEDRQGQQLDQNWEFDPSSRL